MKIYEVSERTTKLLTNFINVWELSVRATHLFLSQRKEEKELADNCCNMEFIIMKLEK